jgi:glutaredoxin 3
MLMFEIYTVPNCKWCDKAKEIAARAGYDIVENDFFAPSTWEWLEWTGSVPQTAPQIFVDGDHIGGCQDFMEFINASAS